MEVSTDKAPSDPFPWNRDTSPSATSKCLPTKSSSGSPVHMGVSLHCLLWLMWSFYRTQSRHPLLNLEDEMAQSQPHNQMVGFRVSSPILRRMLHEIVGVLNTNVGNFPRGWETEETGRQLWPYITSLLRKLTEEACPGGWKTILISSTEWVRMDRSNWPRRPRIKGQPFTCLPQGGQQPCPGASPQIVGLDGEGTTGSHQRLSNSYPPRGVE